MGLPASLNERLGPLPIYAWGAIAGGGILAGQYLYKRHQPSSPTAPASTITDTGALSSTAAPAASPSVPAQSSADGSFFAGGTYVPPAAGAGSQSSTSPISDNDEWIRAATTLVAATNPSLTMLQINSALSKYINGEPVTEQQAAIVELALRTSAGQPPYAPPAISIININTPSPVLTPPPAYVPPAAPAAKYPPPPTGLYTIAGPALSAQEQYWMSHYHYHFTPATNPGERIGNPGYWTSNF